LGNVALSYRQRQQPSPSTYWYAIAACDDTTATSHATRWWRAQQARCTAHSPE
jgi:hypothetical protein